MTLLKEETLLYDNKTTTSASFQCKQQTKAKNVEYRLACHALFNVLTI